MTQMEITLSQMQANVPCTQFAEFNLPLREILFAGENYT